MVEEQVASKLAKSIDVTLSYLTINKDLEWTTCETRCNNYLAVEYVAVWGPYVVRICREQLHVCELTPTGEQVIFEGEAPACYSCVQAKAEVAILERSTS